MNPCIDCLVKTRCRIKLLKEVEHQTKLDHAYPLNITKVEYLLYLAHFELSRKCEAIKVYMNHIPGVYYGTIHTAALIEVPKIIIQSFDLKYDPDKCEYS